MPCALCAVAFEGNSEIATGTECCSLDLCALGQALFPSCNSLTTGVTLASSCCFPAQIKVLVVPYEALSGLDPGYLKDSLGLQTSALALSNARVGLFSVLLIAETRNAEEGLLGGTPHCEKFPSQRGSG